MRNTEAGIESEAMHHRKITLPDGRYMIFYTFGEEMREKNGAAHETEQHLTSTSVSSPSQPEEE